MKTNANLTRFLAISALALALPLSAMADGRDRNRCERGDDKRPPMEMRHKGGMPNLRGIDLSAEQISALSKLRDEQRKAFMEKGQAMRDQQDALRKLTMSDAYTKEAAANLIDKISVAQTEMATLRAEQDNQLYKILTPEQRTKMQQNELIGGGSMRHGHKR